MNSYLPRLISEWGAELGYRTVLVSTDCVFSGHRGRYTIDDYPDAADLYGRSKALGEPANDRDVVLRTSIVGPELGQGGSGLLRWFMGQKTAGGWANVPWTGITTLELAKIMLAYVTEEISDVGLWQCVPYYSVSKYELLVLFNEVFKGGNGSVVESPGDGRDRTLVNNKPGLWSFPRYGEMIKDLHGWVVAHRSLYVGTPFEMGTVGRFDSTSETTASTTRITED